MIDKAEAMLLSAYGDDVAGQVQRIRPDPTVGAPCVLARTITLTSYPTAARSYFACVPVNLLGTEVEGGAGTLTDGDSYFLALNLGSKVPPTGTYILGTFEGNRWVFRHDA